MLALLSNDKEEMRYSLQLYMITSLNFQFPNFELICMEKYIHLSSEWNDHLNPKVIVFPAHNIVQLFSIKIKWAATRENLSSGFLIKRVSSQSPQLQRLARKLKFHM